MVIPALRPYEEEGHLAKMIGLFSTNGIPNEADRKKWIEENNLLRIIKEKHHCPNSKSLSRKQFLRKFATCVL